MYTYNNTKSFTFGENRYTLEMLNPLDAMEWGGKTMTLFGPALASVLGSESLSVIMEEGLEGDSNAEFLAKVLPLISQVLRSCGDLQSTECTRLLTEATRRCYTPRNEPLSDMTVYNGWFREHPGDLFPLGILALFHLVKDFFMKPLVTGMSGYSKMNSMKEQASL